MAKDKIKGLTMPNSTSSSDLPISDSGQDTSTDSDSIRMSTPKSPTRKSKIIGSRAIIPGLLGVSEIYSVTKGGIYNNSDEYLLRFKTPQPRVCAHCGSNNCTIKDAGYDQSVRHKPVNNRGVILTIHRDRYKCKDCHRTSYQQIDFIQPDMQITRGLYVAIAFDLMDKLSIAQICRKYSVSTTVVYDVMERITPKQPSFALPETLCIDEFKGDARYKDPETGKRVYSKFQCCIANGTRSTVYDILPDPKLAVLRKYFERYPLERRKNVLFFCSDMRPGFITLGETMFPNAEICIDPFHVVHCVMDAVSELRRDTQNAFQRNGDQMNYKLLKGSYHPLLTKASNQDEYWGDKKQNNLDLLATVFNVCPNLELAYNALQKFYLIIDNPKYAEQRKGFDEWCKKYQECGIVYLESSVKTLKKYRKYILNAWKFHRSNSIAEGLNNVIKSIKKHSFGIPTFETLRARCLLILGDIEVVHEAYTIFGEKRAALAKANNHTNNAKGADHREAH